VQPQLFDAYGVPLTGQKLPEGIDVFYQWPIVDSLTSWDTKATISASSAHEVGDFVASGRLFWAMLSHARIVDGLEKRGLALRGMRTSIRPGKGPRAKTLAKVYQRWRRKILRAEVIDEILAQAILMGQGIAQPVWNYDEQGPDNPAAKVAKKWWIPRVQTWEPMMTRWIPGPWLPGWTAQVPQPWLTVLGTLTAIVRGAEREGGAFQVPVIPGSGQWLLLKLAGDLRPWMWGRLRSVWRPWIFSLLALLSWLRFNDRHGLPILGVKVPMGMRKQPEAKQFYEDVKNVGQMAALQMPQMTTKEKGGVELDLIEAKSESWRSFQAGLEWSGKEITILLTGGTQNTEATGGNYKGAEEQKEIRHEVKVATAISWDEMENEQLAGPFATLNGYEPDEAPIVETDITPPSNRQAEGKAAEAEAKGLSAAVSAWHDLRRAGAETPLKDYLAQRGFELPDATKYGEPTEPPPIVKQVLGEAPQAKEVP